MSHLFQRPLCEMGAAFDYAYRPLVGVPRESDGGGCDDRTHRAEFYAAAADPGLPGADWRGFSLCPEHEEQLREYDATLREKNIRPRFRGGLDTPPPSSRAR